MVSQKWCHKNGVTKMVSGLQTQKWCQACKHANIYYKIFCVMPRLPRIEFTGAFYHIIVRGNNKQSIFLDDQDRYKYLGLLERYKKQHGFIIYAYTLMNNHVHLLIETLRTPISKIMQVINFTYTSYFNRKHKKVGHLFQGRYKSYLCDRDTYLLALVRYIHLNPVRAKLAKNPQEYSMEIS
jgi:REP element-mobilizing transposase RayT